MASEDTKITEGWVIDPNKNAFFQKKSYASLALGVASSDPTIFNVKRAFGAIIDVAYFLVHGNNLTNKKRLEEYRSELDEIQLVLFGDETESKTKQAFIKYNVEKKEKKVGVDSFTTYTNLTALVLKLSRIFGNLNEYAQETGFGSIVSQRKSYGLYKLMENSNISSEEMGVEE